MKRNANQDIWISEFERRRVLWIHDDNPKRPHALLSTSGKHSDGFFNAEQLLDDAEYMNMLTEELLNQAEAEGLNLRLVECVAGPAMGAITLAHDLSRHITRRDVTRPCRNVYAERDTLSGVPVMAFKRRPVKVGEYVLIVEDVITSGGSVSVMTEAISRSGAHSSPYVLSLLNRSAFSEIAGKRIISLVDYHLPVWEAEDCPLCKQGSEAIWPKGAGNWAKLNAVY